MSEYGPGLTIGMEAELDKERIKHALKGELVVDENEDGFVYVSASASECSKDIIYRFEKYVFKAQEAWAAARAYDAVCKKRGINTESMRFMMDFMEAQAIESKKYQDFVSDFELEELEEDIREIENPSED